MASLEGASAIVTGAAQGIGRITALKFATSGTRVTILDVNGEGAHAVAEEVVASGGEAHVVVGDVAKESDIVRAVEETTQRFGGLDILVNNAVVYDRDIEGRDINVVSTPDDVWARTMDVNLHGAVLGCRHAIPAMLRNGGGAIVNVGSTAGFSGDTNHVAYAASMAAKYSLTRSIATSHGRLRIRCNAIATGLVLSPTARQNLDPVKMAVYRDNLLTQDFADPEDIAKIILFLSSDGGRYITGQTIIADGGFQAHQPWHAQAHIVHPEAVV